MEELWIKLKRNLARSYKSIRFNWRQYASFFAAIFLMQAFFWLIMLTQDARRNSFAATPRKITSITSRWAV